MPTCPQPGLRPIGECCAAQDLQWGFAAHSRYKLARVQYSEQITVTDPVRNSVIEQLVCLQPRRIGRLKFVPGRIHGKEAEASK